MIPNGINFQYQMKYWGIIYYSKVIFPHGVTMVVVSDFKFDDYNLTNWMNHAPLNEKPFIKVLNREEVSFNTARAGSNPFPNGICRLVPLRKKWYCAAKHSNGKCYLADKYMKPIGYLVWYDSI